MCTIWFHVWTDPTQISNSLSQDPSRAFEISLLEPNAPFPLLGLLPFLISENYCLVQKRDPAGGTEGLVQKMYRALSGTHFWVPYEWFEPFIVLRKLFRGAPQKISSIGRLEVFELKSHHFNPFELIFCGAPRKNVLRIMNGSDHTCETQKWVPVHPLYIFGAFGSVPLSLSKNKV